jgi:carbonic anhydrase
VNVGQSTVVREAWARGQALSVHGWIYDVGDGILQDLGVCYSAERDLPACFDTARAAVGKARARVGGPVGSST